MFEIAAAFGEIAKRMLRQDGRLQPIVFLFRGVQLVQVSAVIFEDQPEKFLVWQRIADDVARTGAEGLIFIGEASLASPEKAIRGVRPTDTPGREEVIHVVAVKATGEVQSLFTPFSRGWFGRIKVGETEEFDEVAFNFVAPVRAVWRARAK